MKPGGGMSKGAKYERAVCRELSLWISVGEDDDLFRRSAMSGGRATNAAKVGRLLHRQVGDVSAIDQLATDFLARFFVECKHHHDLELRQLICKQAGRVTDWWDLLLKQAKTHSRHPLLIAKGDLMPPLLGMTWEGQNVLRDYITKRGGHWRPVGLVWIPSLDLGFVPWEGVIATPLGERKIIRKKLVEPGERPPLAGVPGTL